MKIENLKESHLTCRTVLHFSEYGFHMKTFMTKSLQQYSDWQRLSSAPLILIISIHENHTISIFYIYFVELTTACFDAPVKSLVCHSGNIIPEPALPNC